MCDVKKYPTRSIKKLAQARHLSDLCLAAPQVVKVPTLTISTNEYRAKKELIQNYIDAGLSMRRAIHNVINADTSTENAWYAALSSDQKLRMFEC